jgi:hypothetical protein
LRDPDPEPTLIEDFGEVGHKTALALRSLIDRVPFLNKGAIPFIFLPVLLLGSYFQALGLWSALSSDYALLAWPSVRAEIIASGTQSESFVSYRGRSGTTVVEHPDADLGVRYRYRTKGQAYESTSFGLGGASFLGDPTYGVADWVREHPIGSRITAYVNPRDPSNAAIDPRPTLFTALEMLVAMGFTLIGLTGVLAERVQARIDYEMIAGAWGLLAMLVYFAGHAFGIAVGCVFAIYFVTLFAIRLSTHLGSLSTLEEDLNAPPQDISDFSP